MRQIALLLIGLASIGCSNSSEWQIEDGSMGSFSNVELQQSEVNVPSISAPVQEVIDACNALLPHLDKIYELTVERKVSPMKFKPEYLKELKGYCDQLVAINLRIEELKDKVSMNEYCQLMHYYDPCYVTPDLNYLDEVSALKAKHDELSQLLVENGRVQDVNSGPKLERAKALRVETDALINIIEQKLDTVVFTSLPLQLDYEIYKENIRGYFMFVHF